ncbi:MAG: NUDIX hydrolase [Aeropyrum sp.]|nr:NUDIX hydrolase [Aeropyrum sp.]MCE4615831.1 NUDIX hydrolase [Aeropyrum sp.]
MKIECRGRRVKFEASVEALPNGRKILVDRVVFPDSVAILPLIKKDGKWHVVLVRQFRPSISKWTLEAPAGAIGEGESPEDAAIRELEEEAGLRAYHLSRVGGGHVSPGYSTEYLHLYLAIAPSEGEARPEDYEVIEGKAEIELDEAVKMVYNGGIEDIKTIALILAAKVWVEKGVIGSSV